MTPTIFHVLLALSDGDRHGYGIMQEVSRYTDGRARIGPGALYRAIKQLVEAGLIVESGDRPDPSLDDERRRYYRLTNVGRLAAIAEAKRLEALVGEARNKRILRTAAKPEVAGGD